MLYSCHLTSVGWVAYLTDVLAPLCRNDVKDLDRAELMPARYPTDG